MVDNHADALFTANQVLLDALINMLSVRVVKAATL